MLYLDADDCFTDDAIDKLMEEAEIDPEAMVISAMCQDFISPELTAEEASRLKIEPRPYRRMLAGCMLIRREVFDVTGNYDEDMATSETAKWVLSIRDAGLKIKDTDHIVLARRYHLNNLGRTNREAQMNSYMDMIRKRVKERSGKI